MTLLRIAALTCLVCLCTPAALAQDQTGFAECVQTPEADDYDSWAVQLVEECDTSPVQLDALRSAIAALLVSDELTPLQNKLDALAGLRAQVLALTTRFPAVPARAVEAFALALQCDIHQLNAVPVREECADAGYSANGPALRMQKWQTLDVRGSAYKAVFLDVLDDLDPECLAATPNPASRCHSIMTEQFIPILGWYNMMSRVVLPAINRDAREAVVNRFAENHLRWKNYVQGTGFQYPWELLFNKRRHGGFHEVVLARQAPTQRWILMHPTAGLYHSNQLADGSQTDLLGIVKLVGKRFWRYGKDNQPQRQIGVSATATFADLAGIDDVGYGVMFEYNGFALGLSRHGDQQLLVFNVELNSLLGSQPQSFRQWLNAAGF